MEPRERTIDIDELIREIERYLAAIAVFRAAGCDVGGIERRLRSAGATAETG